MFALSWPLTLVTLASLPPTLLVSKVYRRYSQISKNAEGAAEATTVAEETLSSVFTVRAFAGEPFASRDFRDRLAEFKRQNAREARYVVTYTFCLTATPMLVTVLVLWYGGMLVLRGELNPGALVSFMLYQQQLTSCFSAVADVFTAVTTALGAAEKVLAHRVETGVRHVAALGAVAARDGRGALPTDAPSPSRGRLRARVFWSWRT